MSAQLSDGLLLPSLDELAAHRWDSECYEVAAAIAHQWPQLETDAGYYVHPTRGAGDHGWNIAPDGTIVDMTATQHGYSGLLDELADEDAILAAPSYPEIIAPDHPHYGRYVSWTRHERKSQLIAHGRGEHYDPCPACPRCRKGKR